MMDFRSRKSFHAAFYKESIYNAFLVLSPNHGYLGKGGIRYPHFRTIEQIMIAHILEITLHTGWIGTMIGFGESETTQPFPAGQFGEEFSFLLFGTISVDRKHNQ